ncbi:nucleotidyltransferase family protein [Thioclava sp. GXIMD4215]|uniref:nucleotidyltransferase family protein n=1 Tax=Thioclava sp. GXIMD4215 TaxID=3131928 RepID=UPI003249C530
MCDTPDSLMLFAAGFGTRMGALTADRPKPLVEVAGRPLLDHALELVEEAGISKVVANIHYRGDQIVQHLAGRSVEISDETDEILETGGGLRKALPLLGQGPVFTLNTDAIWTGPNPLAALRAAWDPAKMSALLMLVPPERATGHKGAGDFTLSEGRLSRGPGFVYTGAQLIDPAELSDIPEGAFSLNLLWDRLLTKGRVYGVVHDGGWCDVGRPESIPLAEALLDRGDD